MQTTGIDHFPGEGELDGEVEHRVAQPLVAGALRDEEIGRAGRVADIRLGGLDAFRVVGFEQRDRRFPLQDQGKLPGEVVAVLDAGIGAARAERRHLVGGVADKQHTAVTGNARSCDDSWKV